VEVTLAGGNQRIHVVTPVDGPAHIEVRWAPPGSSALVPIPSDQLYREQRDAIGLMALYRSGIDPTAPVELAQVERYLQRNGHAPAVARPYVVDWVGTIDAPRAGTYRFKLDASGPASLWIDDRPVMPGVSPNTMPGLATPVSVVLTEGDHRIQVRLTDLEAPTRLDLIWAPPGDDFSAIPTARFEPPDAAVDAVRPIAASPDSAFVPLGTPVVRWLASTDGEPRGVAARHDGTVFVTNTGSRQVQQVLGEGESLLGLPAAVSVPSDVEVGPDGAVWTVDSLTGDVVRLNADGAVDLTIDNHAIGLYRPRGIAVAPDGSVLIADTGGSRIVRVASNGTVEAFIGPDLGGPEGLRQPTDVAVGPEGQIFVVNGEDGGVVRLSPDGRYERHWLVTPTDTEKGSHLAVGPDRSIWVSEPEGRRVSRFTFDGVPSGVVDQTRAGRLLRVPVGIAVGADGTLYVADTSLRAIVALAFQQ
jgi:streptogramin lyase